MAEQIPGPRTLKTHMPLRYFKQQLDNDPSLKVVQVIRNPRDTMVSMYNFYCMNEQFGPFLGTWDDFFELVKAKKVRLFYPNNE